MHAGYIFISHQLVTFTPLILSLFVDSEGPESCDLQHVRSLVIQIQCSASQSCHWIAWHNNQYCTHVSAHKNPLLYSNHWSTAQAGSNSTPLHLAAWKGNEAVVRLLLIAFVSDTNLCFSPGTWTTSLRWVHYIVDVRVFKISESQPFSQQV